ncbi:MAG: hypothetical protein WBA93_02250 [Microcoleaceae cyanobacterium]
MSPEEKEQKIKRLEIDDLARRERIAELERRLGLDSQNKFTRHHQLMDSKSQVKYGQKV